MSCWTFFWKPIQIFKLMKASLRIIPQKAILLGLMFHALNWIPTLQLFVIINQCSKLADSISVILLKNWAYKNLTAYVNVTNHAEMFSWKESHIIHVSLYSKWIFLNFLSQSTQLTTCSITLTKRTLTSICSHEDNVLETHYPIEHSYHGIATKHLNGRILCKEAVSLENPSFLLCHMR